MSGDDSSDPNRRQLLGTLGASVLSLGVAGCSGGGEDENGMTGPTATERATDTTVEPTEATAQKPPTDTTSEPTETATGTTAEPRTTRRQGIEPMCYVDNSVDEFSVVRCESEIKDDQLIISVTIRNDGDQTADFFNYSVGATIYGSNEPDFDSSIPSSAGIEGPDDDDVPPGGTISYTIAMIAYQDGDSIDDVKSYRAEVSCNNPDSGVYCG